MEGEEGIWKGKHGMGGKVRFVVNADDLGYSRERDDGIFEAVSKGIVTSMSLLVNGPSAKSAIAKYMKIKMKLDEIGEEVPSLGLHINLTEGRPIASRHIVPSLLRENKNMASMFRGKFGFEQAVYGKKINLEHVRIEALAQIRWFYQNAGFYPSHVDGHNHVHVLPGVAPVVAALVAHFKIGWIRLPLEKTLGPTVDEKRVFFLRRIIANAKKAQVVFEQFDLKFPNAFYGMWLCGKELTVDRIVEIVDRHCKHRGSSERKEKSELVVEIMTHPGYPSTKGDAFSKSGDRVHELEVLISTSLAEKLAEIPRLHLGPFPKLAPEKPHRKMRSSKRGMADVRCNWQTLACTIC